MGNVPVLRFPEFGGDWQLKRGGELFSSRREKGSADTEIYSVTLYNGLQPRALLEKHMYGDAKAEANFVVYPNDIAYNMMRMWQGSMGLADTKCMISPAYVVLEPKRGVSSAFYLYLLKSHRYLYHLWAYSHGLTSDRLRLYYKDFAAIPLPYTSEAEQQKVAGFLIIIDTKIRQLKRKYVLLQQYKKGLMRQLFSQEFRFNDDEGRDYPAWKEKRLGDIFNEIKTKVGKQNIATYSITAGLGFVSQKKKFGKDISGEQNTNYIVLQKGQFSYNKGNSKSYKYGCVYRNRTKKVIAVPNVFISFALKDSSMSEEFYEHLYQYHYLDRHLRRIISSSARMDGLLNVNKKYFFDTPVPVPSSGEQIKIGGFLDEIDKKIQQVNTQITQAETFKTGLLQQMFV